MNLNNPEYESAGGSELTPTPHILCLDDDLKVLAALKRTIRKKGVIHTASSGAEALEILKTVPVHLLITDLNMPEMSGIEFLHQVKRLGLNPQPSKILLTGNIDSDQIATVLNQGEIDLYLRKPWKTEELLVAVDNELSRYRLAVRNHDLTLELQKRNQELTAINAKLQRYVDVINKSVITSSTDLNGIITSASQAFAEISKYPIHELIGQSHSILRHPSVPKAVYADLWNTIKSGQIWRGELLNLAKDGTPYWVKVVIEPERDVEGTIIGYTSVREDITDKKHVELLSNTDQLTGLFNRRMLDSTLNMELSRVLRYDRPLSVILLDIDRFKSINDTFGHATGDKVLVEYANILKSNVRDTDTLGRWGGEEFMIICPETDSRGAEGLANKLRERLAQCSIGEVGITTGSFGVSTLRETDSISTLVSRADKMLYMAKQNGRNRVEVDGCHLIH